MKSELGSGQEEGYGKGGREGDFEWVGVLGREVGSSEMRGKGAGPRGREMRTFDVQKVLRVGKNKLLKSPKADRISVSIGTFVLLCPFLLA